MADVGTAMGPTLETIFGGMKDPTLGQECARAVLIFFYGLVMLRLSGRRTFAQMSAIDLVISIVVGSNLSRAMTGGVPLWGTLASVIVLVVLHLHPGTPQWHTARTWPDGWREVR